MTLSDVAPRAAKVLAGMRVQAESQAELVRIYGHLFEHSPWVVERAWSMGPFSSASDLHTAFMEVLERATPAERLSLLRAHPELADKVAISAGLTADSAKEQAGAGLDRLSPEEFSTFHELNRTYRLAHGVPFVICVKLNDKGSILAAMRSRIGNPTTAEVDEAVRQVGLISLLRLAEMNRSGSV